MSRDLRDSLMEDSTNFNEKPVKIPGVNSIINRGSGIAGILGVGGELSGLLSSKQALGKNFGSLNQT